MMFSKLAAKFELPLLLSAPKDFWVQKVYFCIQEIEIDDSHKIREKISVSQSLN